jgi:hypothetical protein
MIKKNIYFVPLFLAIFSFVVIAIALQLDTSPEMIVGDSMQARSFPIFLMILNLILVAVLTLQFYKNHPNPIPLERFPTWGSMILFFVFYLLTVFTDMFIGIFIVMFLMCVLWGEKKNLGCLVNCLYNPCSNFYAF